MNVQRRGHQCCTAAPLSHKSQKIQTLKLRFGVCVVFCLEPFPHRKICGIFCVAHLDLNGPLLVLPRSNSKLWLCLSPSSVMMCHFKGFMGNTIPLFSCCAQELGELLIPLLHNSLTLKSFCSRVIWHVASGSAANTCGRAQISFHHCRKLPVPHLVQVWSSLKCWGFYLTA